MNSLIPSLSQFEYKSLESATLGADSGMEVAFEAKVIPARVTQRVMIGLMEEKTQRGIAVAFFPATGEVCDLSNDGGVIGYLSDVPLLPGEAVACKMKISRFGRNQVCTLSINGETFLYPSFSGLDGDTVLSGVAGQEFDESCLMIGWSDTAIRSSAEADAVAA